MSISAKPILILGGTGKTGRRLAERLAKQGRPVRIGSRSGQPAFDWNDQGTWKAALDGVGAVYISYYPDLAVPGAAEAVGDLSRLAVENGVKRLVLLSGRGEPEAQLAERMVQQSGADWTILRCSWFSQNFTESYLLDAVLSGDIALPAGDIGEPFVDADDIADVAAAAFADDRHIGQLYELTGPRLLTFAEATAEIAGASGRDIRYTQLSAQQYAAAMAEQTVPEDITAFIVERFTEVLDERNAYLTDGVQRALGREPRDFRDYARAAATTGVWSAPQ